MKYPMSIANHRIRVTCQSPQTEPLSFEAQSWRINSVNTGAIRYGIWQLTVFIF